MDLISVPSPNLLASIAALQHDHHAPCFKEFALESKHRNEKIRVLRYKKTIRKLITNGSSNGGSSIAGIAGKYKQQQPATAESCYHRLPKCTQSGAEMR